MPSSRHRAEQQRYVDRLSQERDRLLASLDPSSREIYEACRRRPNMDSATLEKVERNREILWKKDFERKPVDFREFVSSDKYLGKVLRGSLFPILVDDLEEMFAGSYNVVVLGGGIGWGKTRAMAVAICYEIYKVSCFRNPARALGLIEGSDISFPIVSVTKEQAQKVLFKTIYSLMSESPYFTETVPFDRKIKTEIRFPTKGIVCYPAATNEDSVLGTGVFGACMDEANFYDVVESSKRSVFGTDGRYDLAQVIFDKVSARMRSRNTQRGILPGHLYVASAARYPDDFVERLMQKAVAETEQGFGRIFARRYPTWGTRPEGHYSKTKFRVELGNTYRPSRVLTGNEKDVIEANVIEVAEDFRPIFENDPNGAVRDVAGYPVAAIHPFFGSPEKIQRMFQLGDGLRNAFTKSTVTLQVKDDPSVEALLPENLDYIEEPRKNSMGLPLIQDGKQLMHKKLFPALYYAHVDLAKNHDAAGVCVVHSVATTKVRRRDVHNHDDVEESKPIIRVDLLLRVVAPPGGEIDVAAIRGLFFELQRRCMMQFGKVTYDSFGSQESIKTMKDQGFNVDLLSMDKSDTPYETLRLAIYDERVLCPYNDVLERELVQLERHEKKIDHPSTHGASKDVADAFAGAIYNCEQGWAAGEQSRGLFQIGLVEYPGPSATGTKLSGNEPSTKVVEGIPLTPEDEDVLLFGDVDKL